MSQLAENFTMDELPNAGNAAGLHLIPTSVLKRMFSLLNALSRMDMKNGKISRFGDKILITYDDPNIASLQEKIAQLQNDYTELSLDADGNLTFNAGGGLATGRVDGNSGGTPSGRNDFGTGFSGGTGSAGSTNGGPVGSGGANSDNSDDGGGGDTEINPAGDGARVVAAVSTQTPQLAGGTVPVACTGTVYNFTGVATSSVVWTVYPVLGVDAQSKPGELVTFNFSDAGQYILTLTAVIDGISYSDTQRVTVVSEDTVTVSAGGDLTLDLGVSDTLNLAGSTTGSDIQWTQAGGAAATIADPSSPTTGVTFSAPGTYRFNIVLLDDPTKTDSMYVTVSGAEQLVVSVNPASTSTYSNELPSTAQLRAYVSQGGASIQWTKVSGPGTATFSGQSAITSVTVSAKGWYVFRITATYEGVSAQADVSLYAGKIESGNEFRVAVKATGGTFRSYSQPGAINPGAWVDGSFVSGNVGARVLVGSATFIEFEGTYDISDPWGIDTAGGNGSDPSSVQFFIGDPSAGQPLGEGNMSLVGGLPYEGGGLYSIISGYTP